MQCEWQCEARRCGVVLGEVFAWLSARDLAVAGAACRAWRRAAAAPPLWRRLLLQHAAHALQHARALAALRDDAEAVSWRQEYVRGRAGWRLTARHAPGAGATLLHASLAPARDVLALAADDASLAVWRLSEGTWRECWRTRLATRGWASVARVQWADAPRLLLAGPRALSAAWELMVLRLDDDYGGATVASRVRCSAGAAGCWADPAGDAFLSLELQLFAPGLACTTVWLNAATQETQSEYTGVTAPLLRIFNENAAPITHVIVAGAASERTLVAGAGGALSAWPVLAPRPPPLVVGAAGELCARVRRRRERRGRGGEARAPSPSEAEVRALCVAPARRVRLRAALAGLARHGGGRALWALCSDASATCVCARSLDVLLVLRAPGAPPAPPAPLAAHYVQPAVSERYLASPCGDYSRRVCTWSLGAGVAASCGAGRGELAGPALGALLPRDDTLLVLAADSFYVWRSRATPQPDADC